MNPASALVRRFRITSGAMTSLSTAPVLARRFICNAQAVDEFTLECLVIRVARRISPYHVLEQLTDLFILYGVPDVIRSDNGLEFRASTPSQETDSCIGPTNGCRSGGVTGESSSGH